MEVILLEKVKKLGNLGEIVNVKPGYARNFLLPQGKALRATNENKAEFEQRRAEIEAQNASKRGDAQKLHASIDGQKIIIVRQASEAGLLYGSVSARDIADALSKDGQTVTRQQIILQNPIKSIGLHTIPVRLHAEVEAHVTVNVARSEEEAGLQFEGHDLTIRKKEEKDEDAFVSLADHDDADSDE